MKPVNSVCYWIIRYNPSAQYCSAFYVTNESESYRIINRASQKNEKLTYLANISVTRRESFN